MIQLSDDHEQLIEEVDQLAENEFRQSAFEWDGSVPWENLELLAERDLLGINLSEEYGGGGTSYLEPLLIGERIGRICPETVWYMNSINMMTGPDIERFGTEEAKEKYLGPLIAGEHLIFTAISEPEAGSDVMSMNTTVSEEGDDLIINGEKTWVGYVPDSTAGVVWAKFPDGIGSVIVDVDTPGFEVQEVYTNMAGFTQTHFTLDDVTVPRENILTKGKATELKAQLEEFNWKRMANVATANGVALGALEKSLEYAQQREQFGQSIAEFQGIEWKFSEMVTRIQASRALLHNTAKDALSTGRLGPLNTSIATLYSAKMADDVVDQALQIFGARAYQRGHPIEQLYRFIRGLRIGLGTDEIQRNTIARFLKKQGVPSYS
jgi:alkylation response protein AidB-like acyl-CoA dehydrogenase